MSNVRPYPNDAPSPPQSMEGAQASHSIDVSAMDLGQALSDHSETSPATSKTQAAIRQGEAGPDKASITVVALTAYALKSDRDRLLEEGMDDYLSKPIDNEELDRVLAKAVARKHRGASDGVRH